MKKTFEMENDIGINITYTILGVTEDNTDKYVVYTNYLPSDNELGVRLFAGKVTNENPLKIDKISVAKQNDLIEEFKVEIIKTGRKIRRVIGK